MSKELSIEIANYQRIKKAQLTFKPGTTLILGSSNQGKSALFRAIETAVFNLPRDSHVSKGQTKSAVKLSYDGHYFIWLRDLKSATKTKYIVDGKEFLKVGRTQLEEIGSIFNMKEIEISGIKERLNFSSQLSYPFLLNRLPSELFKFFSYSSESDNLTEVLSDMVQDFKSMKKNILLCTNTMDTIKNTIAQDKKSLSDIVLLAPTINTVLNYESTIKKYIKLNTLNEEIKSNKNNLNNIVQTINLNSITPTTKNTIQGMDIKELENMKTLNEDIKSNKQRIEQNERTIKANEIKENTKNKTKTIGEDLNEIEKQTQTLTALNTLKESLALQSTIIKSNTPIDLSSTGTKLKLLSNYLNTQSTLNLIQVLSNELKSLNESLSSIGICPYCGSPLNKGA